MAKQIDYPADTVDASGKVWDTVGENIRNGSKQNIDSAINKAIDEMLNAMYPVGYTIIGEIPPLLKEKFEWSPGTITSSYSGTATLLYNEDLDAKINYSTYWSSPILSPTDLNSFNEKLGLSTGAGCFRIPFYHRVK